MGNNNFNQMPSSNSYGNYNNTPGQNQGVYGQPPPMPNASNAAPFGMPNNQLPNNSFNQPMMPPSNTNNASQPTPAFFTPTVTSQPQAPSGFPSHLQGPSQTMGNQHNIMNPSSPPAHGILIFCTFLSLSLYLFIKILPTSIRYQSIVQ